MDWEKFKNMNANEILESIMSSGKGEEYLTPENALKLISFGVPYNELFKLIRNSNNLEKYKPVSSSEENFVATLDSLCDGTSEEYTKDEYNETLMMLLIIGSGNLVSYLNKEMVEKFQLNRNVLVAVVAQTGLLDELITSKKLQELDIGDSESIAEIIELSRDFDKYITPEKMKAYGIEAHKIAELATMANRAKDFLQYDIFMDLGLNTLLNSSILVDLIVSTGNIGEYLSLENIKKYKFDNYIIQYCIENVQEQNWIDKKESEHFLDSNDALRLGLSSFAFTEYIRQSGNYNKYLTPEVASRFELEDTDIARLAIEANRVEEFLKHETIDKFRLNNGSGLGLANLILESGHLEEYLTVEKFQELGGFDKKALHILFSGLTEEALKKYLFDSQKRNLEESANTEFEINFSFLNLLKAKRY